MDLVDWLEMGSPYLHMHSPDLVLLLGVGSPCGSSSPLSENAVEACIAEATPALQLFSVHYMKHYIPRCDLAAEAWWRLRLWELYIDLVDGLGTGLHPCVIPSPFLSKSPLLQRMVILSLIDESFISGRVTRVVVWLFYFEELNAVFHLTWFYIYIYIYIHIYIQTHTHTHTHTHIYIFSRRFYPKQLTVHSGYTFFVSVCSLGIEPPTFALLTQCSTTEPQEHIHTYIYIYIHTYIHIHTHTLTGHFIKYTCSIAW